MRLVDLFEAVVTEGRDAPLFHGTGLFNASEILRMNTFKGKSEQLPKKGFFQPFPSKPVVGVSLTRSKTKARDFGDIVFELDQTKLAHNYRLEPFDYWGLSPVPAMHGAHRRDAKYAEAEEFIVGDIRNASRYIRAIHMSAQAYRRFDIEERSARADDALLIVLKHPLLKIDGVFVNQERAAA